MTYYVHIMDTNNTQNVDLIGPMLHALLKEDKLGYVMLNVVLKEVTWGSVMLDVARKQDTRISYVGCCTKTKTDGNLYCWLSHPDVVPVGFRLGESGGRGYSCIVSLHSAVIVRMAAARGGWPV